MTIHVLSFENDASCSGDQWKGLRLLGETSKWKMASQQLIKDSQTLMCKMLKKHKSSLQCPSKVIQKIKILYNNNNNFMYLQQMLKYNIQTHCHLINCLIYKAANKYYYYYHQGLNDGKELGGCPYSDCQTYWKQANKNFDLPIYLPS